jgi:predicted membrane protein (TIGR00267 family)
MTARNGHGEHPGEAHDEHCDPKQQGIVHRIKDELEITGRYEVARRHFAMEIFDGILPILGIIIAGILVMGTQDSLLVFETTLLAAVGTSIAHFMSGFSASYLTETAEGESLIQEFDEDGEVPRKLSHSILLNHQIMVTAERDTTILLSLIMGATPAAAIITTISPMLLSLANVIHHVDSFYASLVLGLIILSLLGFFLGQISRKSKIKFIVKTLLAAIITMFLIVLVSQFAIVA